MAETAERYKRYPAEKREQARAMWLAGEQGKAIGLRIGVPQASVHQWATRGGWRELRKAIVEKTEQSIMKTTARVSESMVEQHLTRVNGMTSRQLDSLERLKVKQTASVLEVARALDTLDKVQRRALGLDVPAGAKAPRQTINLHLGTVKPRPIIEIKTEEVGQ